MILAQGLLLARCDIFFAREQSILQLGSFSGNVLQLAALFFLFAHS
jgi:hypothetical protein